MIRSRGACAGRWSILWRVEAGRAARRCAGARASRYRDGPARRPRSSAGSRPPRSTMPSARESGGPRQVYRRRSRDRPRLTRPGWPAKTLDTARATLEAHGDRVNAAHARYLEVRRLLLIGHLDEAERALADLNPALFLPHREQLTNWSLRELQCGVCARRPRARHLPVPNVQRTTHPCADGGGRGASLLLNTPAARLSCEGSGGIPLCSKSRHWWRRTHSSWTPVDLSCVMTAR